jgi:hypothetical protein
MMIGVLPQVMTRMMNPGNTTQNDLKENDKLWQEQELVAQ